MALIVTSKAEAPGHYDWADCIISIDDPGSNIVPELPKHLLLIFEDIEVEFRTAATIWDIRMALRHAAIFAHRDNNLLIHCYAGISRSTAMAWGILIFQGYSIEEAWNYLLEVRPCADPNLLIVGYFDRFLRLQGKMQKFAMKQRDLRDQDITEAKDSQYGYRSVYGG